MSETNQEAGTVGNRDGGESRKPLKTLIVPAFMAGAAGAFPLSEPLPQDRLDVDNRRLIDGFDWSDAQAVPVDRSHHNGMKTQRVRPIRRSRREHARERIARVGTGVNKEDVAARSMKPRDDDDFVSNGQTLQSLLRPPVQLQPGFGCSLRVLLRRSAARLELGSNHADRPQSTQSNTKSRVDRPRTHVDSVVRNVPSLQRHLILFRYFLS